MKVWRYLPFLVLLASCGGSGSSSETVDLTGHYQAVAACAYDEYQFNFNINEEGDITGAGTYVSHLALPQNIAPTNVTVSGSITPTDVVNLTFTGRPDGGPQTISFSIEKSVDGFNGIDRMGGAPEAIYTLHAISGAQTN